MKKEKEQYNEHGQKDIARLMSAVCVRNTIIEDYHSGITPTSKTGDYSDVKVVTPYGEIPWNELSRISDPEMKSFNKEVCNRIYTFLYVIMNPKGFGRKTSFLKRVMSQFPHGWDEPTLDIRLLPDHD